MEGPELMPFGRYRSSELPAIEVSIFKNDNVY